MSIHHIKQQEGHPIGTQNHLSPSQESSSSVVPSMDKTIPIQSKAQQVPQPVHEGFSVDSGSEHPSVSSFSATEFPEFFEGKSVEHDQFAWLRDPSRRYPTGYTIPITVDYQPPISADRQQPVSVAQTADSPTYARKKKLSNEIVFTDKLEDLSTLESYSQYNEHPQESQSIISLMFRRLRNFFSRSSAEKKPVPPHTLLIKPEYYDQESNQKTKDALRGFKKHTREYSIQQIKFVHRTIPILDIDPAMRPPSYHLQLVNTMNMILNHSVLSSKISATDLAILEKYRSRQSLTETEKECIQKICSENMLKQKMAVVHHAIGTGMFETRSQSKPQIQALKKLSADLAFSIQTTFATELQMLIADRTDIYTTYTPDKKNAQRYQDLLSNSLNHIPPMNSQEFKALDILFTTDKTITADSLNLDLCIPTVFGEKRNKKDQYSLSLRPLDQCIQKIKKIQKQTELLDQQIHAATLDYVQSTNKKQALKAISRPEAQLKVLTKILKKEHIKLDKEIAKLAKNATTAMMKSLKKAGYSREASGLPFTERSPLFQKTTDDEVNQRRMVALNYLYKVAESSLI